MSNLPRSVMLGLRDTFQLTQFMETGTCDGNTALMAAAAFSRVITIEIVPMYHSLALQKLSALGHVQAILGDSRDVLRSRDWSSEPPTLFYLDAHKTNDIPFMYPVNCPLLDELRIIGGLHGKHCIVVDDYGIAAVNPVASEWECASYEHRHGHTWSALTPVPCDWDGWLHPTEQGT